MEKYIHEPNDNFNFDRVTLKTPFSNGGGGFFSKFIIDGEPFYIKTPKCSTKQGFIKSSKRYYCDLVFSIVDHEDFIRWMENLVIHSQQILLKKSGEWFQDPMGENEIEDATISPLKTYRAGKYYLVRCNVPSLEDGSPEIKAYDENSCEIPLASINENMNVIGLLEIRGIKCSLKSFQFEINIKQIMVVKKINILEKCLLSHVEPHDEDKVKKSISNENTKQTIEETERSNETIQPINNIVETEHCENDNVIMTEEMPIDEITETKIVDDIEEQSEIQENTNLEENSYNTTELEDSNATELEDSNATELEDSNATELEEINLEDFETDDKEISEKPIILKNPNELYYNMYFEAKKKAKEARMKAITSYLEAKNIKMLYDLDDIDDNESEDDFMNFNEDEDEDEDEGYDDENNNSDMDDSSHTTIEN